MDIIRQIATYGVIPVVSIRQLTDAVPLARALVAGGLPAMEVTFRTEAAADAIEAVCAACPEMLVGAGTVLTVKQADAAIAAGAKFLVSPGLNPAVVRHVMARGVTMFPGCASPTDFEAALALGLSQVKFFPAEALGGVKTIDAMTAPYGGLRLFATGGITPGNMAAYLAHPAVFAVGGSFIASADDIAAGRFAQITANAKAAVAAMLGIRYAGAENDCIVLTATSLERAYAYLCSVQTAFDTVETDKTGKIVSVCLADKLGDKTIKLVNTLCLRN